MRIGAPKLGVGGSVTDRIVIHELFGVALAEMEPFEGDGDEDGFVEGHGLIELRTFHECKNTGHKPRDRSGIDDFCFPSGVRVVMEPIRILDDVPQLLDILCVNRRVHVVCRSSPVRSFQNGRLASNLAVVEN